MAVWHRGYKLSFQQDTVLQLPASAICDDAVFVGSMPTLWVTQDDSQATVARTFRILGGSQFNMTHLSHVACIEDRQLVWHVFEVV